MLENANAIGSRQLDDVNAGQIRPERADVRRADVGLRPPYVITRSSWLPRIETVFVDAPDQPSQGCGEPPIVCTGAVVANALFDATGARLTDLPLTPPRVRAAIAASAGRKGEPESVHLPRIAASRWATGPLFVR